MAAETDETSTNDERDANTEDSSQKDPNNMSQAEMAEQAQQEVEQREHESKAKAGPIVLAASVVLGAIGLTCLYLSTTVMNNHPLAEQVYMGLGLVNLVLALCVFIRKNWPRATVLAVMPITIVLTAIMLTVVGPAKYAVMVLCVVEIYLMFRRPILDEFDAPKE